ncbi:1-deoxy-D-xylulose-5-phosphate synthase [Spiroplasma chinense]|uniref:1-deoxy-D-xylulose-5-phosphate synthase n=1 Tax=Spiroplasma chinense TaxID=216932 RepID=A0A5B9Y5B0_9MOLU|nr:1-deoxy-D-xylulose-5-phosphate synthase N-terminal domain-containing protein [Spiroplasma chinense]QEH61879.1 1-deoxy-D-xylulose-5-phosphate synthase [Spiroplasma chinense]
MKLDKVINFKDVYKNRDINELNELCDDIREFLINNAQIKNGHIGSSLGVVELTVALLSQYNCDESIILFDTGHQSQTYKILTNRKMFFESMNRLRGLSSFQEMQESKYDWISNGHSGTALGYAFAYAHSKTRENIISVVGDAVFYSAYNHAGLVNLANIKNKTITILNDNGESIGENGIKIQNPELYVKSLGLDYVYCEDGHDFNKLFEALDKADACKNHVVVHVKTIKANKYNGEKPLAFNHTIAEDTTGSYQEMIAEQIEKIFDEDSILISPGMINSSLFTKLQKKYPNQVIDCGINEELCVLMACGFAKAGKKVYVSIFSAFFQRTFDQLVHDVMRNNLPIVFLIDRAGLNYTSGVSHHGIYDVSLINNFKDSVIFHPFSYNDILQLKNIIREVDDKPLFVRYEKGKVVDMGEYVSYGVGKWHEIIFDKKNTKTLIAYGPILKDMYDYIKEHNLPLNLVNARFINPIDFEMVTKHYNNDLYIYELVIDRANLFVNIRYFTREKTSTYQINLKDRIISHGRKHNVLKFLEMDIEKVINHIMKK